MVELDHLLKLNPADLQEAIRKGEEQLARLDHERQRLMTFTSMCRQWLSLIGPAPTAVEVDAKAPSGSPRAGKGKNKVRVVDAAFEVLSKAPSMMMHGQVLLATLRRKGCRIGGMHSLSVMLRRDPRFRKDSEQENVWTVQGAVDGRHSRRSREGAA